MTLAAGAIGMLLSWALTSAIGTLPFLGPAYEDDSGKVDIHLALSLFTLILSTVVLVLVEKRQRSEEHTSELQSRLHLVCRLLLEKKKNCFCPNYQINDIIAAIY